MWTLALHRYESVVIGNGLANQGSNPDVDVDITKPDIVIRSQIAVLKEMTSWLKAAHSGNDISVDSGEGRSSISLTTSRASCRHLTLVSCVFQARTAAEGRRAAAVVTPHPATQTSTSPLRRTLSNPEWIKWSWAEIHHRPGLPHREAWRWRSAAWPWPWPCWLPTGDKTGWAGGGRERPGATERRGKLSERL